MIIQRKRQIKIVVDQHEDKVLVQVSGKFREDSEELLTHTLLVGEEMTINYETLSDASETVEAAVLGAMALEDSI